ncbi:PHP domain-containing protein [Patescibacteria group bacterium]|nr:PHP domain-containing protein [Patescibacteria group bacterium]
MLIKTNLHFHTGDDPLDNLSYSAYQAIDHANKLGFGALSFTCHTKLVHKKEYEEYANKKNILLLPGIEATIEDKHVVIINCDKEIENIRSMEELRIYKKNNPKILIIAPHPFVWSRKSLGKKLVENIDLFDAIELSVFSNKFFNFNKKAIRIAKKHNKPIIATSDTHSLKDLKRGYTLINAENKNAENILSSIKNRKFKNKMDSMGLIAMARHMTRVILFHLFPRNNRHTTTGTRIK